MKQTRISHLLSLALLGSATAWAAPPLDAGGGATPVAVSGVYQLQFNVKIGSQVPAGATIACKARMTPNLGAFSNLNQGVNPVETRPVAASVSGSTANCALEIPFSWIMTNAPGEAQLSYEIDAVHRGVVTAQLAQTVSVRLPTAGSAARMRLNLSF